METRSQESLVSVETAARCVRLIHDAAEAADFQEWSQGVLPELAVFAAATSVFVYVHQPGPGPPLLVHHHVEENDAVRLQEQIPALISSGAAQNPAAPEPTPRPLGDYRIEPLSRHGQRVGYLGTAPKDSTATLHPVLWQAMLEALAGSAGTVSERRKAHQELSFLGAYLDVSYLVAQFMDLKELLENVLYFCTNTVQAEEASVLLLDDAKENFFFYQVEGPTKPLLMSMRFPANRGIAGAVLQSQQSEIVRDVGKDPRFLGSIDSKSGFKTRNMIAVPLTAGKEPVGVLEVVNKTGGGSFTERERLLLESIAEEIAFAIRNAILFEVVVNSYCKQRQGLNTCKGCKRPLGSWTPCVKYRQPAV